MPRNAVTCLFALNLVLAGSSSGQTDVAVESAAEVSPAELQGQFDETIQPFLTTYCSDCHGADDPEGMLNLSSFASSADVVRDFATWDLILRRVEAGEMPPQDDGQQPSTKQRRQFVNWSRRVRAEYAARHAGDPGEVLARRLSSAEYNYTIRDLTGVDIRPASEFPIDPSNEAGFDNSGESLTMTPALLNKYLDAARLVSQHLLLAPDGLAFATHPVVTVTDRDKYCVRRIIDFYGRQNTRLADYFFAAWQIRQQSSDQSAAIESVAQHDELSGKYLRIVWKLLDGSRHDAGPIRELRQRFMALPGDAASARRGCDEMQTYVQRIRSQLRFDVPHLRVDGINRGSQTLVLWRNRQRAGLRMTLNPDQLIRPTEPHSGSVQDGSDDLWLPRDAAERTTALSAWERFCEVFPDRFYVDRRGREYLNDEQRKSADDLESEVRLLSAGFHSMMGYFRDDQPLYELMLNPSQQQQLDRLWFELDFITDAPARQHAGFIWFERAEGRYLVDAEFDAFRSEDKRAASEEMIARLGELYIAKAKRLAADPVTVQAMRDHFQRINADIRSVEQAWPAARQRHVADLLRLARQAYRRPLSEEEQAETKEFYRHLIDVDGLEHAEAVRDVWVSILMSPHFCYQSYENESEQPIAPLSDQDLANRLSYFLWSSMPDRELSDLAADQQLHDPEVLRTQVSRMLGDEKARGLAVEFVGHWLGFRQFQSHNSVDRGRFPQFDDQLRQSMFEEPVRFARDVIQNNRSVLDFLFATDTFVDSSLAKHYGIEVDDGFDDSGWTRVENANDYGRGGILPMSVFMTGNSPGLRTSPVKRGYWVVRQLLGESIPPPPPGVPDLPDDESELGELTLREALAQHRAHASCAGCHDKFDSLGLAFEGYGPIGELRDRDLAGNEVDVAADFPDGSLRRGVAGLQEYLRQQRQDQFVDTLCRKLLSYALSRSLILSDDPLLESMKLNLRNDDYRLETLVHCIVTSEQFLNRRGKSFRFDP